MQLAYVRILALLNIHEPTTHRTSLQWSRALCARRAHRASLTLCLPVGAQRQTPYGARQRYALPGFAVSCARAEPRSLLQDSVRAIAERRQQKLQQHSGWLAVALSGRGL